jgi:hypothetical protein
MTNLQASRSGITDLALRCIKQCALILRCEPTGLAYGKPEDRLREPRRMVGTVHPDEHPSRPGETPGTSG